MARGRFSQTLKRPLFMPPFRSYPFFIYIYTSYEGICTRDIWIDLPGKL